jgi:hypothetical protein
MTPPMDAQRIIINIALLTAAALNLAFIVKYASFSRWFGSWIGRSIMIQKIVLTIICLMFPINSFLMRTDDGTWFKDVQIVLFGLIIVSFAIDFVQLFDAQRTRMDRTLLRLRVWFHRRRNHVKK